MQFHEEYSTFSLSQGQLKLLGRRRATPNQLRAILTRAGNALLEEVGAAGSLGSEERRTAAANYLGVLFDQVYRLEEVDKPEKSFAQAQPASPGRATPAVRISDVVSAAREEAARPYQDLRFPGIKDMMHGGAHYSEQQQEAVFLDAAIGVVDSAVVDAVKTR